MRRACLAITPTGSTNTGQDPMRHETDPGGPLRAAAPRFGTGEDPRSALGSWPRSGFDPAVPALRTLRLDAGSAPKRNAPLPLRLQCTPCEIPRLAAAYRPDDREDAAFAAGTRIRNGAYTRANLAPILTWKVSDRGRG